MTKSVYKASKLANDKFKTIPDTPSTTHNQLLAFLCLRSLTHPTSKIMVAITKCVKKNIKRGV
jgi:hypothetical protein